MGRVLALASSRRAADCWRAWLSRVMPPESPLRVFDFSMLLVSRLLVGGRRGRLPEVFSELPPSGGPRRFG